MGKLAAGRTYREWRPMWRNDLWASSNFKTLPINYKGLYEILWSLCRDEEYAGLLCWPTGVPMTIKDIIRDMLPQPGDRIDRIIVGITELMKRGMLYLKDAKTEVKVLPDSPVNEEWLDNKHPNLVLVVRKYAEKSAQSQPGVDQGLTGGRPEVDQGLTGGRPEVDKRLAGGCQGVGSTPPDSKGIEGTEEPHKSKDPKTEESKTKEGVAEATSPIIKKVKREYPTPDRNEEEYNAPDLVGYFCKVYEESTGLAYMPNFAKDGKLIAGLLKRYCSKSIINAIKYFFFTAKDGKAWHADKLSIGIFIEVFNDMVIKLKEENANYIQMRIV